jgi:hypothetical protein
MVIALAGIEVVDRGGIVNLYGQAAGWAMAVAVGLRCIAAELDALDILLLIVACRLLELTSLEIPAVV